MYLAVGIVYVLWTLLIIPVYIVGLLSEMFYCSIDMYCETERLAIKILLFPFLLLAGVHVMCGDLWGNIDIYAKKLLILICPQFKLRFEDD